MAGYMHSDMHHTILNYAFRRFPSGAVPCGVLAYRHSALLYRAKPFCATKCRTTLHHSGLYHRMMFGVEHLLVLLALAVRASAPHNGQDAQIHGYIDV